MKRTVLFIDTEPTSLNTFLKCSEVAVLNIVTLHPASFEMKLVPEKVDLVIVNVSTAEGVETLQLLKQNPSTSKLHIVALVNRDALYNGDSSLEAGADGAVGLPLDEKSVSNIMTFLMSL